MAYKTSSGSGRKSRFMARGTGEGDWQVDWPGCAILEGQSMHRGGVPGGADWGARWSTLE